MIKKVGIDIVTNSRIQKNLLIAGFIKRILSPKEYEYYQKMTNDQRKLEFLCGRFAVKEAIFKAFTSNGTKLSFCDITIDYDVSGSPIVRCDKIDTEILISISHCEEYTIAMALLQK